MGSAGRFATVTAMRAMLSTDRGFPVANMPWDKCSSMPIVILFLQKEILFEAVCTSSDVFNTEEPCGVLVVDFRK